MKNRTKTIIIVSVLIIVFLSLRNCSCNHPKKANNPIASDNDFRLTNPPIPELDIPYQKFVIDPKEPHVLYSKMGAKINIPSDAFLDKDGKVIKGKVEVSFREFYNPLDFYLAGIPMDYNDNGVDKVLESGGMVELTAQLNKKELFVNPSSKITVDLFSWTKSKDFNLYDLDKKTGKWIEKGKDVVSNSNVDTKLNSLPPIPPKPIIASSQSFSIIDDTKMYPEIEAYKNVLFEPINIDECKISNASEMKIRFLENGKVEVTSILKYGSFRKENKCLCYLAFEPGQDYNAALKIYQKKYEEVIKKRRVQFQEEEKIVRMLTINNFGFSNIDKPTDYPSGGILNPLFVDKKGNKLELHNVVLIEKNTNTLFRYSSIVKYNPNNINVLWGLTKDNKIAYIKNDDFKVLAKTDKEQTVKMHIFNKKNLTYEDIMGVLF
jgi:hypothetical protein